MNVHSYVINYVKMSNLVKMSSGIRHMHTAKTKLQGLKVLFGYNVLNFFTSCSI